MCLLIHLSNIIRTNTMNMANESVEFVYKIVYILNEIVKGNRCIMEIAKYTLLRIYEYV